jgi:beta-lactamase regulating signal transducer with metallopeptidase domain
MVVESIARVTPLARPADAMPGVRERVAPAATNDIINPKEDEVTVTPNKRTYQPTRSHTPGFPLKVADMLPLFWLVVALVLTVSALACNFKFWRIIRSQRPLTKGRILDLFEDCKTEMGIKTIIGVVVAERVKSPALFGIVRPRLLLPEGIIERLGLDELRYVFLHELAHHKRHDIYLGWLMVVLQVLHWFNPLVWYSFHRMRTDRELACDGLVLEIMGPDNSQAYGQTLVNLFKGFSQIQFVAGIAGILENKSRLQRRITMIAGFKRGSYRWSLLVVVLLAVLAVVTLTDGRTARGESSALAEIMPESLFKNLVLYYSFDKDGGTKVVDISGMDFHGKVHGARWMEEGSSGGGMSFDGENDYIIIDGISLKAFTFSAFVKVSVPKADATLDNRRIFLLDDGEHFYAIQLNNKGGLGFGATNSRGMTDYDIGVNEYDWSLVSGQWTHVVVSYDGSTVKIYKDGRLSERGKDSFKTGLMGTAYLGGTTTYRGEFWYGKMDEVAVFNRALSNPEVRQLYRIASGLTMETVKIKSKGLVGHWSFDEGSGSIAYDSAGTNHGTLVNGPVWTTGPIGGALEFDGGDDYIEVPYDDSLAITDEITIGTWVNIANAVGAGQHYVVDSRDGTGGGYGLNVDTELIQFYCVC